MTADMTTSQMFAPMYGALVLEMVSDTPAGELLGETTVDYTLCCCGETLDMVQLQEIWEQKLEPVYPLPEVRPRSGKTEHYHRCPGCPQGRCGKAQGGYPGVPRHQLRV